MDTPRFNLELFLFNLPEDILKTVYTSESSFVKDLAESVLLSRWELDKNLKNFKSLTNFSLGDLISFLNLVIEADGGSKPLVFDFCDLYPTELVLLPPVDGSSIIALGLGYSPVESKLKTVQEWFDYLCENVTYGLDKYPIYKHSGKDRILLVAADTEKFENNQTAITCAVHLDI